MVKRDTLLLFVYTMLREPTSAILVCFSISIHSQRCRHIDTSLHVGCFRASTLRDWQALPALHVIGRSFAFLEVIEGANLPPPHLKQHTSSLTKNVSTSAKGA
jgi:hypothetical protein